MTHTRTFNKRVRAKTSWYMSAKDRSIYSNVATMTDHQAKSTAYTTHVGVSEGRYEQQLNE